MTTYPTSIGTSTPDEITLLGSNLATELLGRVTFGELALWLLTGSRPGADETFVFEALLVSLADHGFTPTAIAARMTLYSAPDSLQGAVAAGLLGGGSRFLGVTEDTGKFLARALRATDLSTERDATAWDALAVQAVMDATQRGEKIPGLGHPVHKTRDPRTPVLVRIARERDVAGAHVELLEAIGRVHSDVLGRTLPLNGAGVVGAILVDLGVRPDMLRGVALLARTAGLLGHLAEEQVRPVAPAIYAAVDRNAVYESLPAEPRS